MWSNALTRPHGDDKAKVPLVHVWSNALTRSVVRWPTLDRQRSPQDQRTPPGIRTLNQRVKSPLLYR